VVCVEDLARRCSFRDNGGKTRFASRESHDTPPSKSYAMSLNMHGDDSKICIRHPAWRARKIRDDVSRLRAVANPGRMTEKESPARAHADF
jgi:hypothetical protein